jgi:hypothetical protein
MSASEKVVPLHNEMQKKMERIQNGHNLGAVPSFSAYNPTKNNVLV